MINRDVQKTETFSGIDGVNAQDVAVQESMGYVVDRTRENLSRTDMAIIYARRMLLQATRTVAEGETPPGVAGNYYMLRPAQAVCPWTWIGGTRCGTICTLTARKNGTVSRSQRPTVSPGECYGWSLQRYTLSRLPTRTTSTRKTSS